MKEIEYHPAYSLIKKLNDKGEGNNIFIDYVILQNDKLDSGIKQHKRAAINGMKSIVKRYRNKYQYVIQIDESKMLGVSCSAYDLFEGKISALYQHFFLEPPYGNELNKEDFIHVNNRLFSNIDNIEIYDWCSGIDWNPSDAYWENKWSNYFDDGLEWWGVIFYTIYDELTEMFIIIAASTTD